MRRWREQSHIYYDTSPVMPPSIIRQNRNNPDFHDILDGSYGVEVVLEREVGPSFEVFKVTERVTVKTMKSCLLLSNESFGVFTIVF